MAHQGEAPLKRGLELPPWPVAKRSASFDYTPASGAAVAGQDVGVDLGGLPPVVARALFSHCPALAAPAPSGQRSLPWGLDRLMLDDQCGEGVVRALLQNGSEAATVHGHTRLASLGPGILSLPEVGQGLASSVGMAIGQQHLAATFSRPGFALFDHRVFVMCRGGALSAGVVGEASSLAGHLQLKSLVVVCCDDGLLGVENTAKRFEAYGWSVAQITIAESTSPLVAKLEESRSAERPTLLLVREGAGMVVSSDTSNAWAEQGATSLKAWSSSLASYGQSHPDLHAEVLRRFKGDLPKDWANDLPEYHVGERAQATRQSSAKALATLVTAIPEMIGGSADLTGSCLTNQGHLADFQHNKYAGRHLRFGVREHGMIAICTGLALYGGFLPFCATFLNFFTYAWGALRLACQLSVHAIYIATHDSIDLGEDGPTHQPIEVLPMLRAMPNLLTFRPADGTEVVGAYEVALKHRTRPSILALSRGGTPHLEGTKKGEVAKGGYVIYDFDGGLPPTVVLAGSGTEVTICMEAKTMLESVGVGVRVLSVPCWELFEAQPLKHRQAVFAQHSADEADAKKPPLRVYVEASSTLGFQRYADIAVGMTTFGASGPAPQVKKFFGFDKQHVAAKVLDALQARQVVSSYKLGRFGFCKFSPAYLADMGA